MRACVRFEQNIAASGCQKIVRQPLWLLGEIRKVLLCFRPESYAEPPACRWEIRTLKSFWKKMP